MSVVVDLSPIRIGWLGEIDAGGNERHVLQRAENRMTLSFSRRGRLLDRALADSAEDELASRHVDLRAFEARVDPNFCHDIVGWIVAPPGSVMLRLRG